MFICWKRQVVKVEVIREKKKFKLLDKAVHTPAFMGSWTALFLFWVLITWRLNYQFLLVGLISTYALTRFNQSMIIGPAERFHVNKGTVLMGARYLWLMLVAIVKANIDVAKIVLQRKMPISPGIVKFKTGVKKDFDRVVLANSITLTPGTLTIDMIDDVYVVHCLTRANAEEVCNWDMEKELIKIEQKGA
jgi:multicomponent Na+:H+ antiporter subunit E